MSTLTLNEVKSLTESLMDKWGLISKGWEFEFISTSRILGRCSLKQKTIQVSKQHVQRDSDIEIRDTILHEISHALHFLSYVDAGRESDFHSQVWNGRKWVRRVKFHGPEWKRFAVMVGANPRATKRSSIPSTRKQSLALIAVYSNTDMEFIKSTNRVPSRLHLRFVRGRRETFGKLFVVKYNEWEKYGENKQYDMLNVYR